ncbi:agamous-like MADS-box protein AGL62 [Malania oleifera]|uniref:agamous-like MADS-box protein AGL62 n=1 Tax=Malania oleifera TaxID=397392 RepID=UPI0025AE97D5|nr:agamous-like MADS-box protein AGL62 [Malania oleifera]
MFKKAGELCVLCGVQIAVIAKSPGNKFFSFGHPSVDAVVDQYLAGDPPPPTFPGMSTTGATRRRVRSWRRRERRRPPLRKRTRWSTAAGGGFWWEAAIDGLGLEELEQFQASLTELKENLNARETALLTGDENFLPLSNL